MPVDSCVEGRGAELDLRPGYTPGSLPPAGPALLRYARSQLVRRVNPDEQRMRHEIALAANHLGPVAGVDEAGRGCCAGPLTAAACILPSGEIPDLALVNDSKQLTALARKRLFPLIQRHALAWSIVHVSVQEIDRIGIQAANMLALRRAVYALSIQPGFVLVDGYHVPGLGDRSLRVIRGDDTSRCIGAASILAKHARDQHMIELDARFEGYGFAKHKGYGTAFHMNAVRLNGPTEEHRYSFKNVQQAAQEWRERA